jgi:hypothetical protein
VLNDVVVDVVVREPPMGAPLFSSVLTSSLVQDRVPPEAGTFDGDDVGGFELGESVQEPPEVLA